jgi:hypothetical protein
MRGHALKLVTIVAGGVRSRVALTRETTLLEGLAGDLERLIR